MQDKLENESKWRAALYNDLAVRMEGAPTTVGREVHWSVRVIGRICGDDRHGSFSAHARTHIHPSHISHTSIIIKRHGVVRAGVL